SRELRGAGDEIPLWPRHGEEARDQGVRPAWLLRLLDKQNPAVSTIASRATVGTPLTEHTLTASSDLPRRVRPWCRRGRRRRSSAHRCRREDRDRTSHWPP